MSADQKNKLPKAPKIYFKETYQSRYDSFKAIYFDIKLRASAEIIKRVKCSKFDIIDQCHACVQLTQYQLNQHKIKAEDCEIFIDEMGTEWLVVELGDPQSLEGSSHSVIIPSDYATDKRLLHVKFMLERKQ